METIKLSDKQKLKLGELLLFERLITETYPAGIVSIVSDTWNLWDVIDPNDGILACLKDKIMARDGKVVIRPDSGDPVKIVTGYCEHEVVRKNGKIRLFKKITGGKKLGREISETEFKGLVQCLYEIFGGSKTKEGYIQLDSHIGGIYGDSITLERAEQICERLAKKGFASTNLVYGIGSFTYQGAVTKDAIVTRDAHGFAVKSTYGEVEIEGKIEGIEIFKDPITDNGLKRSLKGLIAVYKEGENFVAKDQATWSEVKNCEFKELFTNSKIINRQKFSDIRNLISKNWE